MTTTVFFHACLFLYVHTSFLCIHTSDRYRCVQSLLACVKCAIFRLLGTRDAHVCTSRRLPGLYRIVPQEGAVAEVVIGTNGPFNCAAWLAEW